MNHFNDIRIHYCKDNSGLKQPGQECVEFHFYRSVYTNDHSFNDCYIQLLKLIEWFDDNDIVHDVGFLSGTHMRVYMNKEDFTLTKLTFAEKEPDPVPF